MKKTILLFLFLTCIIFSFSFSTHQANNKKATNYYYFQDKKFYYDLKPGLLFVRFKQDVNESMIRSSLAPYPELEAVPQLRDGKKMLLKTTLPMREESYVMLADRMRENDAFQSVGYVYTPAGYDDGKTFYGMSDELVIQFKPEITREQASQINLGNRVEIIEPIDVSGGLTYLARVKKDAELNAIDMANKYYEDGLVNYSEPNLYCTNTLCDTTNDQYFWWQWAIRNLGNNVPSNPPNVIADCDMDVDSAWNFSPGGDSTIKICVIDTGVDTNHLDLVNNMTHGLGWDYADNDPWPYDQGNHGTSCASISAAQGNNTIGLAGIAYKCKIIPMRCIGGISAYHGYANGFIRAWQVGSDVITNSWGQTGGASSLLYNAISDAARFGRGGKGCVITFASGNENGPMRFPAYIHPDVIVVGGLAPCNKRKSPSDGCSGESWGASYGSNLDIVAPCVKIYAATVGGGYTSSFNGTSSATPNAAGVCALMLSANPNLTRQEVESYIYLTAEKVGPYNYDSVRTYGNWNQEMGYGRINGRLALGLMLTGIDKTPPVIYHDSIINSSPEITARTVKAVISDNRKLAADTNAPRLYYRVNGGSYTPVNAFSISADTFRFTIPGQSAGTVVDYYFAAQDTVSPANFSTLPPGGTGINPPGTGAPPSAFTYTVGLIRVQASTTTPKICPNLTTIYDTIVIPNFTNYTVITDVNVKINVSHRTDSDVDIFLFRSSTQSELTTDNGGSGDSYWNTVFDDSASLPITSGQAPFTGKFRPETPLTVFNTQPVPGTWILSMYDDATGNFGTLDSWELEIKYLTAIGITETINIPSKFSLHQNYPNPFNPSTRIRYDIPREAFAEISIYDVLGRLVDRPVNEMKKPGIYYIEVDGSRYSSGVYFYVMKAGAFAEVRKMMLLK